MANLFDMQAFKGQISKVKKEVLTHTSGEVEATKIKTNYSLTFGKTISGNGGGGKITTTHEHYTNFKIDKTSFRCAGDYNFDEGDEVMLYASETNQGFYEVLLLKNASSNFVVTNFAKSSPTATAVKSFFAVGIIAWIVLAIVSFILNLFIGADGTAYKVWEIGVVVVAALAGLFFGKFVFQSTRQENAIFDEAYKEIIKYNGEN